MRKSSEIRKSDVLLTANRAVAVLSVLSALAMAGCGSSKEDSDAASLQSGTFNAVYNQTLKTACIECHRPSDSATQQYGVQLDFTSKTTAFNTLFGNVSGLGSSESCGMLKLVVAGSPQTSYLAAMVLPEYNVNNFGNTGCQPLNTHVTAGYVSTEAERASLKAWIQGGAQNN